MNVQNKINSELYMLSKQDNDSTEKDDTDMVYLMQQQIELIGSSKDNNVQLKSDSKGHIKYTSVVSSTSSKTALTNAMFHPPA